MPSFATPARRSRNESSSDSESDRSAPNISDKRQRITNRAIPNHIKIRARDDSKHQPGAIVRVTLKNFVTYTAGDFYPGSGLNMVIGPNGNGKSTLVCAICLGLGWGSAHLGRAKDLGDFVKNGESEATIEIELKRDGKKYLRNPIITTTIRKEGNKTAFSLNGKQSSKKACNDVAKSFSIQIDNLCQFLPQDRVVEFAALSPVELLKSTQRAIASQEMIDWHESLIQLGRDLRNVEQVNETELENLKSLERQQRMAEGDVARLREREEIKQKIQNLEAVRPVVEFFNVKKEDIEARQQFKDAKDEYTELCRKEAPALRAVNEKQQYRDAVKRARDALMVENTSASQRVAAGKEAVSASDRKATKQEEKQENRRKENNTTKVELKRLQGVQGNLQKLLDQGPPEADVARLSEEIRSLQRSRMALLDESKEIESGSADVKEQLDTKEQEIQSILGQIKNLDSQSGMQEQKLKRNNFDTYKAWEWIQKNQDQFQQPILGPPIIECSVMDKSYADMLESLIQLGDMFTLTAQNKADQEKLHRQLKDVMRLKRISTRCAPENLARFAVPNIDVRPMGFDGWAKDYIQGPPGVVAMLCEAANLHRVGICHRGQTNEQFEAASRSDASGWATPINHYRVMRRKEYGPDATSTTVREIRKATFWTDQPIDSSVKNNMQANVNRLQQDVSLLKEFLQEQQTKIDASKKRYEEIQSREKPLGDEKKKAMTAQKTFAGLPERIRNNEEKIAEQMEKIHNNVWQQFTDNDELDTIHLERSQASLNYADAVMVWQKTFLNLQEAEIMLIEAESDTKTLIDENAAVKRKLEEKRRDVEALERKKKTIRELGLRLQTRIRDIRAEASPDLQAFLESYDADKTVEQHDADIDTERSRLELIHDGNAGAIASYERREKEIARLNTKLESVKAAVVELSEKLRDTRDKWEPKLDALIRQISSAFSYNMGKINCNGAVEIAKHEDFDQWAIEIHVRFREGEPMTKLDSHRQSGGERAVSTIFYLMSLQRLTRSPFRVVDEINQGMDPRNERLVHSRMVAIATGNDEWLPDASNGGDGYDEMEDIIRQVDDVERAEMGISTGSQYFLITPKLLHDLRYDEGMTVLTIVSGEHLASSGGQPAKLIGFQKSLAAHQALRQATVA